MTTTPEVQTALAALRENETRMKGRAIERDDVIHGLQLSTICKRHVQLLGPPGTAKSFVCRLAGSQFTDATWFEKLLTRQTLEDTVVGYLDARQYADTGKYVYETKGTLTQAHFAFIDENYKASGSLLNALLSALNERKLTLGPNTFDLPLEVCWAASNETGEDETTQAYADRMVLNYWVGPIEQVANKRRFLKERAAARNGQQAQFPPLMPVTLDQLHAVQAAAAALPVEDEVYAVLADLQERLAGVGVYVSDRRLESCLEIMQAEALLAGDDFVGAEHVEILRHALWSDPADRENVAAAVGAVDKGIIGEVRALVDNALSEYRQLRAAFDPDTGRWSSETARQAYVERCPAMTERLQETGVTIKEKLTDRTSERVKSRIRDYMAELREAFKQTRDDSPGLV
jgi:MoxR-like ATPase